MNMEKKNLNDFQLTSDDIQIIYSALMSYGDKLANVSRDLPNESEISELLVNKARKSWDLAKKIIMCEESNE